MSAVRQIQAAKSHKAINWPSVKRVLVVKLRSIGDTVLATPSLVALKRFLPHAKIDILLEDWVAPLLDGLEVVDRVISIPTINTLTFPDGEPLGRKASLIRGRIGWDLWQNHYDVAFNLHGGTTATFFTAASRATNRVGLADYQYSFLYNHLLSSPADFWGSRQIHSAEQQLALLGFVGVPVEDRPKSRLVVTDAARNSVDERLRNSALRTPHSALALMHPSAAFFTKQWPTENFARTAEFLAGKGLQTVAVASRPENDVLEALKSESTVPIATFDDLTLPEITALAARSHVFVGNDSGIAHIAAAVETPSIVIFGSSNRTHWRPWTDAPNEIVYEDFACQPCAGYECKEFGEPRCILSVKPDSVLEAIERVLDTVKSELRGS